MPAAKRPKPDQDIWQDLQASGSLHMQQQEAHQMPSAQQPWHQQHGPAIDRGVMMHDASAIASAQGGRQNASAGLAPPTAALPLPNTSAAITAPLMGAALPGMGPQTIGSMHPALGFQQPGQSLVQLPNGQFVLVQLGPSTGLQAPNPGYHSFL